MKAKLRVDDDGVVHHAMTDDGAEIPDPVPMAPPVGFKRQEPLHERIRAMVQHEYARVAREKEIETEEEADDFLIPGDEGDDPREGRFALQPGYEWEENYEPPETYREMRERLIQAGWTPPVQSSGKEPMAERPGATGDDVKDREATGGAGAEGVLDTGSTKPRSST